MKTKDDLPAFEELVLGIGYAGLVLIPGWGGLSYYG